MNFFSVTLYVVRWISFSSPKVDYTFFFYFYQNLGKITFFFFTICWKLLFLSLLFLWLYLLAYLFYYKALLAIRHPKLAVIYNSALKHHHIFSQLPLPLLYLSSPLPCSYQITSLYCLAKLRFGVWI